MSLEVWNLSPVVFLKKFCMWQSYHCFNLDRNFSFISDSFFYFIGNLWWWKHLARSRSKKPCGEELILMNTYFVLTEKVYWLLSYCEIFCWNFEENHYFSLLFLSTRKIQAMFSFVFLKFWVLFPQEHRNFDLTSLSHFLHVYCILQGNFKGLIQVYVMLLMLIQSVK